MPAASDQEAESIEALRSKLSAYWPFALAALAAMVLNGVLAFGYIVFMAEPACIGHGQTQGWAYQTLKPYPARKVRHRPSLGWCEYRAPVAQLPRPSSSKSARPVDPDNYDVKRVALYDLLGVWSWLGPLSSPAAFALAALLGAAALYGIRFGAVIRPD